MIDVKLSLRRAYYDLLTLPPGLIYNGNLVPVVDDAKNLGDGSNPYVLLSNQAGVDASTFQTFDSTETLVLDIVYKAGARVNKAVVDNVAGQILDLVLPSPGMNGLSPDPSIWVDCLKLNDDRYIPFTLNNSNSVIRRLLTFKQHVRQTGSSTPPTPIPAFQNPIIATDFADATDYAAAFLKNRTYLLYLNGAGFLANGTQWSYLPNGGFTILLNNFDATKNSYTFYLLLQG